MDSYITLADKFNGHFQRPYDGRQDDELGRADFCRLTNNHIIWTQVHGDFKNVEKRALFVPYPHWRELHECCGVAVAESIKADPYCFYSDPACARIMGAAMVILRKKYGLNVPRWWIPVMNEVRGVKKLATSTWKPGL